MGGLGRRFSGLGSPPEGRRARFEGSQGARANRIGTAVYTEQESVPVSRRDEIAATMLAAKAVGVPFLNVPEDLLPIVKGFAACAEKEIVCDHICFTLLP